MIDTIIRIAVLLFAVTIHEYSHGKAALSLGDPTAKNSGRLTLNPIRHIDPIGAVCMYLFGIGWAKPVPVNTAYFANRRKDTILMAISGPVSNLAAAFVAGLLIRYYDMPVDIYRLILVNMLLLNIGLGLFNLLPIPPLDGSHVLENILPSGLASGYQKIRRYAPIVFLGILIADHYLKFNIFGRILSYPIIATAELFAGPKIFHLLRIYRF
ncbi:MAG: site-2 protease family protein [Deltaproteobacteria bacterium]|nr:site-2 protease family protein [Deltaproteobacteria bacterium]